MRFPTTPPRAEELPSPTPGTLAKLLQQGLDDDRYLHWDQLRHRPPPGNLTAEEWWLGLKLRRLLGRRAVPLKDMRGDAFSFSQPNPVLERLHDIDLRAGGTIEMPDPITNPETKDQYYVRSLVEEAITSSQLEGATTTRRVAREMLRTGREPSDRSERMILNNYRTMRRIGELRDEPLARELVFELHSIVTDRTLDDDHAAGRFRRADERVVVTDDKGNVLHEPPPAKQLASRMRAMCNFANGTSRGGFIHPVIQSIVLHFWLAYDHPFVDGNGRTARALFYWSMLRHGYWLFEFISISQIILQGPAKYGYAFLYAETDDNDLTYFLVYHLGVIKRAIDELHDYIDRKTRELENLESTLRGMSVLNHRQRAFVSHALRHPHSVYTVESHRSSHNVAYETARRDLLDMVDRKLLSKRKVGNRWEFDPAPDLEARLARLR